MIYLCNSAKIMDVWYSTEKGPNIIFLFKATSIEEGCLGLVQSFKKTDKQFIPGVTTVYYTTLHTTLHPKTYCLYCKLLTVDCRLDSTTKITH